MKIKTYIISIALSMLLTAASIADSSGSLFWPPAPDKARIEYVGEIKVKELKVGTGFFAKLKRIITGKSEEDILQLPYDLVVSGNKLLMTCQGIPYLIEIDLEDNSFQKHQDDDAPLNFPICLADGGRGVIFVADSENRAVYKFENGDLKLFISTGLTRPTGLTAKPELKKLYIVDTGEHNLKIYNYKGELLDVILNDETEENKFHFPTFTTTTKDGYILINDALNYKIKKFDSEGLFVSAFGSEGDSPGSFSRPKGIATDSDDNIYVIDNLFDNMQIFNQNGQVLLALGAAGQLQGQFWSPSGIDIKNDTIYIADTFNNRIQILHYLGDTQ